VERYDLEDFHGNGLVVLETKVFREREASHQGRANKDLSYSAGTDA
jgi:hypothetical protein